jgi:hypothetical protein
MYSCRIVQCKIPSVQQSDRVSASEEVVNFILSIMVIDSSSDPELNSHQLSMYSHAVMSVLGSTIGEYLLLRLAY